MASTVLIVDDDSLIQLTLSQVLSTHFDVSVLSATTPVQAFDYLGRSPVHLIILDMNLPGMDGKTMLEQIRKHADKDRLPVIVCTAMADRNLLAELAKLGINDFIVKPFRLDMVVQKFQMFLPLKTA
jgi:DNA-binding response OmpR family regulator